MAAKQLHFWRNEKAVRSLRTDVTTLLQNDIPTNFQNTINKPEVQHLLLGEERNESFFGLYYTFLVADALDFDNPTELQQIAHATALLRAYVVFHDALIDNPNLTTVDRKELEEVEQLFFSKAREMYVSSDPTGKISGYFDKYAHEYKVETKLEKTRHHDILAPFTEDDLDRLGRKTCLINVPLCAVALKIDREDLIPELSEVMKNIMIASQLSDDLRDWETDVGEKNLTYPLTTCILRIIEDENIKDSAYSPEAIRQILFYGDVLEDILVKIVFYFNKAHGGIQQITSGSLIEGHLQNVIKMVQLTAQELSDSKRRKEGVNSLEELLRNEVPKWFLPSAYLQTRAISENARNN